MQEALYLLPCGNSIKNENNENEMMKRKDSKSKSTIGNGKNGMNDIVELMTDMSSNAGATIEIELHQSLNINKKQQNQALSKLLDIGICEFNNKNKSTTTKAQPLLHSTSMQHDESDNKNNNKNTSRSNNKSTKGKNKTKIKSSNNNSDMDDTNNDSNTDNTLTPQATPELLVASSSTKTLSGADLMPPSSTYDSQGGSGNDHNRKNTVDTKEAQIQTIFNTNRQRDSIGGVVSMAMGNRWSRS